MNINWMIIYNDMVMIVFPSGLWLWLCTVYIIWIWSYWSNRDPWAADLNSFYLISATLTWGDLLYFWRIKTPGFFFLQWRPKAYLQQAAQRRCGSKCSHPKVNISRRALRVLDQVCNVQFLVIDTPVMTGKKFNLRKFSFIHPCDRKVIDNPFMEKVNVRHWVIDTPVILWNI